MTQLQPFALTKVLAVVGLRQEAVDPVQDVQPTVRPAEDTEDYARVIKEQSQGQCQTAVRLKCTCPC